MSNKDIRTTAAAIVVASLATIVAIITFVLFIGANLDVDPASTGQGSTYVSLYIMLFGAVVMLVLFAAFLYIGVEDKLSGFPLSSLYWPQTAVKGTMAAYMMTLALTVVDLSLHGLKPTWAVLYTPTAKIFQSLLLLLVFASFAWVLMALLLGRVVVGRGMGIGGGVATILLRLGKVELRQEANDVRAGIAEHRADDAHARADVTDVNVDNHKVRLEATEGEVLEIKTTIKKVEPPQ